MYVMENESRSKTGKVYRSVLLRESYREGGKVKNRTIANLSKSKPEEIAAIRLALRYKDDLSVLGSMKEAVELHEGQSVGAVWTVYEVARQLGIEQALGTDWAGKLAFFQILARTIDQGSRLSATRWARLHAAGDVLGMTRGFDENDLYENLGWLAENQAQIEDRLFKQRRGQKTPELFLYDVTSSYLEGQRNALGEYGYNRDGKRGKKQIVIGLLCDELGEPVSTEVFAGNTQDPATFASQVRKASERFGCRRVTFVGDRGMIKSGQVEELSELGFAYITAITKPQIETLLKQAVLQLELFDEDLCEVEQEGVRYILRRNPLRVAEMAESKEDKRRSIEALVQKQNTYLREHPGASVEVAQRKVREKIARLNTKKWLRVAVEDRHLQLTCDEEALAEASRLDGCYVLKTDLPKEAADTQTVHDRYKDLAEVESAFRTCKTTFLEVRPVHVRNEANTRGHVLVVMLAYLIVRKLRQAWAAIDLTVEEGLEHLKTLCAMEVTFKNQAASCLQIPKPREQSRQLLKALGVRLPEVLLHRDIQVVTRKKLPSRRKSG